MTFLSRKDLAKRWGTSMKTIDRQRVAGLLPWIDLNQGRGNKPIVRFRLNDIEAIEQRVCDPSLDSKIVVILKGGCNER